MRRTAKNSLTKIILLLIVISLGQHPIIVSAWGDNSADGLRASHSLQEINESNPFGNTPVFNTIEITDTDYKWHKSYFGKEISDGTITDEKNFVGARKDAGVNDAKTNVWDGNQIEAEDGETYVIRLYAHNNNPNGEDAVAENTKVSFVGLGQNSTLQEVDVVDENGYSTGEKTMKQQIEVNGKISSSNANPTKYWDYVNFQSDVPFHLEYVYGSALLENDGIGTREGHPLSDDIINEENDGVLVGYDAMDGRIPGGYEYACHITIRVKVIYDYEFKVENQVRLAGTKEWSKTVDAKVGDKIEIQTQYKNTSALHQEGVAIKDTLPPNLRYVPGTIKIKNGSHPKGATVNGDALVTNGLLIGSYGTNSNAYLIFTAEVVDEDLADGSNTLVNWVQVGVGDTTRQDYARVVVQNNAEFYRILAGYGIAIAICLILIVILIYRIIKKNKTKNLYK